MEDNKTDKTTPDQKGSEIQTDDAAICLDYTGDLGNSECPSFDDIEEDDEFEDFASQSWSQGQEEGSDSCMWDENWDEDDLGDEFTNQLRAELTGASQNE